MEAVFGKFGPLVFHTRINKDLCKKILKLCNKKNPANHKLVGHMKHQHDIDKDKYMQLIKEPLHKYVSAAIQMSPTSGKTFIFVLERNLSSPYVNSNFPGPRSCPT